MTTKPVVGQPDATAIDLEWLRRTRVAAITRHQLAQVLDIDIRTASRGIERGELPSLRVGRRVLIPRLPLLAQLGASPIEPAPETSSHFPGSELGHPVAQLEAPPDPLISESPRRVAEQ